MMRILLSCGTCEAISLNDAGKNRALASVQKLQELNNAVVVSKLTTKLIKEHLSDFQAVVFTDISLQRALEFDDYCHSHQPPIAFIKSEIRGLFGSIFRDFGSAVDVDGEGHFITSIHSGNLAYVEYDAGERSELQNGDLVVFSEIRGMTELMMEIQGKLILQLVMHSFSRRIQESLVPM